MTEKHLIWVENTALIVFLATLAVSLMFKQYWMGLSIFLGFLLIRLHFWLLRRLLLGLFKEQSGRFRLGIMLIFKYLVLTVLLGGMLLIFDLHALGLLIGVSSLVVSILLLAVKEAF